MRRPSGSGGIAVKTWRSLAGVAPTFGGDVAGMSAKSLASISGFAGLVMFRSSLWRRFSFSCVHRSMGEALQSQGRPRHSNRSALSRENDSLPALGKHARTSYW